MERRELPSNPELVSKEALAAWNNREYKVEFYGDELRVIILGETYYTKDILHKQLELIHEVKPDFVLHEFGVAWIYDPRNNRFERQANRRFNQMDMDIESIEIPAGLIVASQKLGFKIVGCDLTDAELSIAARQFAQDNPDEYEFDEKFGMLLKPGDSDWFFTNQYDEIIPYRDQKMAEVITTYQNRGTKSILTILGNQHARNVHDRGLIQEKGFGYAYIDQTTGRQNIT